MADSLTYYDSPLTGEELDAAFRKIPEIDASVEAAANSAKAAAASEGNAKTSETNAKRSETAAAASQKAAASSESKAASSASAASASQQAAAASESSAAASKTAAASSASAAASSQQASAASESSAAASKTAAASSATQAQSWTRGGTGTREGEDTDNAKYWSDRAQAIVDGAQGWYADAAALKAAHPTGKTGQWAIVGATNTVWVWSDDAGTWVEGVGIRLYKVTFKTDSWGSSSPYTQTAAVTPVSAGPNVTANSQICSGFGVRDDFGTDAAYHLQRLIAVDLNRSKKKSFGNGTLTMTTNNKPKADVELYFLAKEQDGSSFGLSFPGGGSEIVLLWINDQTGVWKGQDLKFDLAQYDAVLVICRSASGHSQTNSHICYKGVMTTIPVYEYDSVGLYAMRRVTVTDINVYITDAKIPGGGVDNTRCWPYRIYGVKF